MGTTVPTCTVCGSTRIKGRGLCNKDYLRAYRAGTIEDHPLCRTLWVNPLVCDCETPDADPARDFGMCQICKRKPASLLKSGPAA